MYRLAAVLVLAVVIGFFAAVQSPVPTHANFAGTNGRIAYSEALHAPLGIYTRSSSGDDEPAFLTVGTKPSWSPDGQKLVFQDTGGIFVIDADGDNREQVLVKGTQETYDSPSWSPDGHRVTVIHQLTANPIHTFELMVMDANSENPEIIMSITEEFANLSRPRWSPDGTKILVTLYTFAGGPGDSRMITVDVHTHVQKRLTPADLQSGVGDWSPDGTQIVFGVPDYPASSEDYIYVANADGSGAHRIGDELGVWPVWSPDGKRILFHADPSFANGLRLETMTVTGTDVRVIAETAGLDADWGALQVIDSVEFTQAIQQLQTVPQLKADIKDDLTPPVPIIADKPAVMRVIFGETDAQADYVVEVAGAINETQQVTVDPTCTPELRRAQKEGCLSVDFYFTPPEGIWSVNVKVRDFTNEVIEEHDFRMTSAAAPSVTLAAVSVCDTKEADGSWLCGSADNYIATLGYLSKILPTANVNLQLTGGVVFEELPSGSSNIGPWSRKVLQDLTDMYYLNTTAVERANFHIYYSGAFRTHPNLVGVGTVGGHSLATPFGSRSLGIPIDEFTVGHLLARTLGVHATNTPLPATSSAPGCYGPAADAGSDWIHEDNLLHSESADEAVEVGFDVVAQKALPGDEYLEITGSCAPEWVSPRTSTAILSDLGTSSVAGTGAGAGASTSQWLVHGTIGAAVEFGPLLQVEGEATVPAGDYTIEVLGAADFVLAEHAFAPLSSNGSEGDPYFSELVPVVAGAAAIRLLDPGDTEIGRITLGGVAPQVTVTASAADGKISASWQITDPDSSDFASLVYYSIDGGATWETLGEVAETALVFDASNLAGSQQAMLKVAVSDGVNTGSGESATFAVPTKGPSAEIVDPNGHSFRTGSLVWLHGVATDAENGALNDNSVTWTSSKDGNLGTGASLPVYDLSTGTHTITLTAKDSDNNTATDTMSITVTNKPLVEGEPEGDERLWGDNDCDGEITSRDNQALSRKVLQQPPLSQTQPCPALGDAITADGTDGSWGDLDCDGEITSRDGQALLRRVLQQTALSQTQPCPVLGDEVTTTGAAVASARNRPRIE